MAATTPFSIDDAERKIDPSRKPRIALKPDGTPIDNDRVEIGPTDLAFREWAELGLEIPQLDTIREFRLQRLVQELRRNDYGGLLLYDPLNIRYATDTSNMQLWITHNPARACFVSADGYIVLFDFHGGDHLSAHLPLVKEVRSGASFFYFESGNRTDEHAARFAAQIDDLMRTHAGKNRRLAVDKIEIAGLRALEKRGLEVFEGQAVTEIARVIKCADEIRAMRCTVAACEAAMHEMEDAIAAGKSENEIWSVLHAGNIKRGGEWLETRIFSSGPRTNPWFQESGPRIVSDGELVALDTDMVGTYGMCCDISRTWLCGDVEPTLEQKELYRISYEHIMTNVELLRPGVSFSEITQKAHRLPERFVPNRYGVVMHGVGLCDEYPAIRYREDHDAYGYDGVFEPGMTICVEVYCGEKGGREGVKLEDQVLITEDGYENLIRYPFEERLLK
ncbi:MAG TPA: dimethylsulfonioproprionate lyase DddP [Gammaproteobacteria bacterium]|nr:dimethylsulfonioproprionate lyase DddP [Gammaproteobacteria bacterium]